MPDKGANTYLETVPKVGILGIIKNRVMSGLKTTEHHSPLLF